MKKLIIIICSTLLFSCSENEVTITNDEYNKLKGIKTNGYPKSFNFKTNTPNGTDGFDWIIILGEDNHEYLTNDGGSYFSLIHYPDCKKCLKKDTIN